MLTYSICKGLVFIGYIHAGFCIIFGVFGLLFVVLFRNLKIFAYTCCASLAWGRMRIMNNLIYYCGVLGVMPFRSVRNTFVRPLVRLLSCNKKREMVMSKLEKLVC